MAIFEFSHAAVMMACTVSPSIRITPKMRLLWRRKPEDRVKNKREHLVPLSKLARETVAEALALTTNDQYLFARPGRGRHKPRARDEKHPQNSIAPIAGRALAVAMQRFAEHIAGDGEAAKTWRANPPTPHDLRRTIATRLVALGCRRKVATQS